MISEKEPFMILTAKEPPEGVWYETAPIEFKNDKKLLMVPVTKNILSQKEAMYTKDEIRESPEILVAAKKNSAANELMKSTDGDYISIRSHNTGIPCAAKFITDSDIFTLLRIEPEENLFIFITYDEVLIAPRKNIQPTNMKRVVKNAENKLLSEYPAGCPLLSTEVLFYDQASHVYKEI